MRIYILGSEDQDKQKLAFKVKEKAPHMTVFTLPAQTEDDPALGSAADYRTEVALAVDRMRATLQKDDTIHVTSLVESVAYVAVNYELNASVIGDDELATWVFAAHTIGSILRDSFYNDYVFFKRGFKDDYNERVEWAIDTVLGEFGIPYIELSDDIDADAEMIVGLIHGRKVGASTDIQESNGNN